GTLACGEPGLELARPRGDPAIRTLLTYGDLRPGARPHGAVRREFRRQPSQRRVGALAGGEPGLDRARSRWEPAARALPAHGDLRSSARPHAGVRGIC